MPLRCNHRAKERIDTMAARSMNEKSLENTPSPFVSQGSSTVGSKAATALSPICLNATRFKCDHDGVQITVGMKKPNKIYSTPEFPKGKDCNITPKMKGPCRAKITASYPSSPECQTQPYSEGQIFLWSNASFSQRCQREETLSTSKDTSSSNSCSTSSCHKVAVTEQTDHEAESTITRQNPLSINGAQWERPNTVDVVANAQTKIFTSKCSGSEDQLAKPESSPPLLQQKSEHTDLHRSFPENLAIGLDEIEVEIQRLTRRLTELQLQKRAQLKELNRHREETITNQAETCGCEWRKQEVANPEIVMQQRHRKGAAFNGANPAGTGAYGVRSSSPCVLRVKYSGSCHDSAAKHKGENRLSRSQTTGTASQLREWKGSVSTTTTSQRTQGSNRAAEGKLADRSKVSRRLSISRSLASPLSKYGQRSLSTSRGGPCMTPSRVVPSRYGRAITPDACRASVHQTSSPAWKMKDELSNSLSVASSPLKRIATLRSGYPSRSGLATTPTREQQRLKPVTTSCNTVAGPTTSAHAAPNFHSSASTGGENLGRRQRAQEPLSASPDLMMTYGRRMLQAKDSPKSTAALYKCLESLLEDSKHFFKGLSPARSHRLPRNASPRLGQLHRPYME